MNDLDLGMLLGQRGALNLVAARCSAADAVALRHMRESRAWEGRAADWNEFCPRYLHLSRAAANRIIAALDEFGAAYFEVAQLTGISPAVYRAISPAVREHAIYLDGEPIALVAENAARVAAAVDTLRTRASSAAKSEPSIPERLQALERRSNEFVAEFSAIAATRTHRHLLSALLCSFQTRLDRLERDWC
jgi:hypothetical protein